MTPPPTQKNQLFQLLHFLSIGYNHIVYYLLLEIRNESIFFKNFKISKHCILSTKKEMSKFLMEREYLVSIIDFLLIVTSHQQITLKSKRLGILLIFFAVVGFIKKKRNSIFNAGQNFY